jgi:ribosomal protein S18 acetylase RimI-like enzyme
MALSLQPPIATSPALLSIRAARLEDVRPVLTLHQEAFADKFGGAFGHHGSERGVEALAAAWQRQGPTAMRGMLVAELHGQIVGTATLRTWEMGSDDTGAAELAFQQVLGLWGATRSIFALSLLDHQIDRGEGFITDVAVLAGFRRRGIAQALLARAEDEARLRRKRFLALYVSGSNQGARALYRRIGFHDARIRRSWLTRLIFGQREWVYMRKDLL